VATCNYLRKAIGNFDPENRIRLSALNT
jgi:hypothetical protein